MKVSFRWHWRIWSLLPSIGVRTRANSIVFEWLCASLWLEHTAGSRGWSGKRLQACVGHSPTNLALPTLRISFRREEVNIHISILGFWLSLYIAINENYDDLPF